MKYEELMKIKEEFRKNEQEVKNMKMVLDGVKEIVKAQEKILVLITDEKTKKLIEEDIKNKKEEIKEMEDNYNLVNTVFEFNKSMFNRLLSTINEEELKEEWLNEAVQELLDRDKKVC